MGRSQLVLPQLPKYFLACICTDKRVLDFNISNFANVVDCTKTAQIFKDLIKRFQIWKNFLSYLEKKKDFNELKLRNEAVSSHKKNQMEIRSD